MFKGFSWKKIAEFFPRWMELRYPDSNGSRLLGIISIPIDYFAEDMKSLPYTALAMSSDYRESYELYEHYYEQEPKSVVGHVGNDNIKLRRAEFIKEYQYPQPTRIALVDETKFQDRILGVNFYTHESGYPWYVELIMDKEPHVYGSVQTIDPDGNISYSILCKKKQNQLSSQ